MTMRCRGSARGRSRARATRSARSGQVSFGAATCRRRTAISCRKISVSVSFTVEVRDGRTGHAKIRVVFR